MLQNNKDFLDSLHIITNNEILKRDVSARFDSIVASPKEYSTIKSLLLNDEISRSFIYLEEAIKKQSINKKTSVLLLLKYLDEIKNNQKSNIDIRMSIPNYDKKIPEGIVHFDTRDRREFIILFILYILDFDCSLIRFTVEDNMIPRFSDYLKFIYVTQTQFAVERYSFNSISK